MEGISEDDVLVIAKKETTYGTDATPAPGANAMLTSAYQMNPLDRQEVARNLDRPGMGGDPSILSGIHYANSFRLEAAGSGTEGVAPAFADILLAAGYKQTIVADTSVAYEPVSTGFDSASMYAYYDEQLRKLLGWRGALGFEFQAGNLPYFVVNGMGLYTGPADSAPAAAADYSAFSDPLPIEDANTPTVTLGGVDLVMVGLTINAPGNVSYRNLPNQEAVRIAGKRNLAGRLEVIMPKALSTFNPEALAKAATLSALSVVHGTTAGNILTVAAPKVQIADVNHGSRDNERTYQLDIKLTATDGGDDEVKYTFT
ncbi:phage tail tube protein [Pyruvatibacter sp.]|uniref:phage tail tube protein n=1 Tax=Pyruvatibacter sp. TaxID=1981328 RepID=UPI0032EECD90